MGRDPMGQCLAEDHRLPFRARSDLGAGIAGRHDGDRDRAMDQHRLSPGRHAVSAPRPRHHGVRKDGRPLALCAFPHVAEPRRAADEPCRSAGEGALMLGHIERPAEGPARTISDFGVLYASNGFIGWLFAVTAPVAIILTVGSNGGLSEAEIASWIFGVFFINGLITILFCALYREPLAFFWTIPGTVL